MIAIHHVGLQSDRFPCKIKITVVISVQFCIKTLLQTNFAIAFAAKLHFQHTASLFFNIYNLAKKPYNIPENPGFFYPKRNYVPVAWIATDILNVKIV